MNVLICQEPFVQDEATITTPCDHKFHKNCLDKWKQFGQNCPYCRTSLSPAPVPTVQANDYSSDLPPIDGLRLRQIATEIETGRRWIVQHDPGRGLHWAPLRLADDGVRLWQQGIDSNGCRWIVQDHPEIGLYWAPLSPANINNRNQQFRPSFGKRMKINLSELKKIEKLLKTF
jgi:hypothetical protein